jgi:hypothetical protein
LNRRELILGVEDLPSKRSGGKRNGPEQQLKSHPQKHCWRGSRSSEWHPDTKYSAGTCSCCVGEDHLASPERITDQSVFIVHLGYTKNDSLFGGLMCNLPTAVLDRSSNFYWGELPMRCVRTCSIVRSIRAAFCSAAFLALTVLNLAAAGGETVPLASGQIGDEPSALTTKATHLIGVPNLKAKLKGVLTLRDRTLVFTSSEGSASIELANITAVSTDDERRELGGAAGKIGRMLIPYGGGGPVALVSQLKVGLLTVEFHDEHHAYHGAVFMLPFDAAIRWQQALGSSSPSLQDDLHGSWVCDSPVPTPNTITVLPVSASGMPVPAEYRVLLYEQLLRRLHKDGSSYAIYRGGEQDPKAICSEFTLKITLTAFKKGNGVVRAASGLVGLFAGVTSLELNVRLTNNKGEAVFERNIKTSIRGDNESLDLADIAAKSTLKKVSMSNVLQSPR